jgi:hypothetical protein
MTYCIDDFAASVDGVDQVVVVSSTGEEAEGLAEGIVTCSTVSILSEASGGV